jgi:hypothetical protein
MTKSSLSATVAALLFAGAVSCQAGPLSWVRDKISGEPAPQAAPAQAGAPAQSGQDPAAAPAVKTPTAEEVKKGAAKLNKELSYEKPPRDLFKGYAGKWKGNFWVYTLDGKLRQRANAEVTFTLQDDGSMKMESYLFDKLSQSFVIGEKAVYRIEGDKVLCNVTRGKDQVDKQVARFNDGQLFFETKVKDGVEHYRERIDGNRFLVDGFAVYGSLKGDDMHIFIARYLKAN